MTTNEQPGRDSDPDPAIVISRRTLRRIAVALAAIIALGGIVVGAFLEGRSTVPNQGASASSSDHKAVRTTTTSARWMCLGVAINNFAPGRMATANLVAAVAPALEPLHGALVGSFGATGNLVVESRSCRSRTSRRCSVSRARPCTGRSSRGDLPLPVFTINGRLRIPRRAVERLVEGVDLSDDAQAPAPAGLCANCGGDVPAPSVSKRSKCSAARRSSPGTPSV